MQQFQSLQRLLIFYTMTLTVMLLLYYFALFHEMKKSSEQQSIDTFYALQHDITEHADPLNSEITKILEKPTFEGISYQLIFMLPSGQTYIHRHTRPNEATFSTITFPKVITSNISNTSNNSAYTLTAYNLAGTIVFKSGHKLHIILRHKTLDIDWLSYRYWLPLMTAIMFFIVALLYMLNRRTNWEQLLLYTDNLGSQAKEAYTPPPFMADKSTAEFLRLGHALSRISYQLHNNHRRIKTLKHRLERLVEQSPLPMVMIMRHGQISFFNQRFEQVFATPFQSDSNYQLTDFVSADDASIQLLLQKLSSLRVTRTLNVHGLENRQAYQLHITPWFGEHGQVHGFTVLLNNTNELVNQNIQLQQKNKRLQVKLDEFNTLKFKMGHDLRLPLESMIDTLEPIDPHTLTIKQNEVLNTLIQTSHSMLTMLDEILNIGEIEVRRTRLNVEAVDLYKLGQQVSHSIVDRTKQQGLELIYFFAPNSPRCIDTDHKRLQQILRYLLDNAIKFTTSGYVALTIEAVRKADLSATENRLIAFNDVNTSSKERTTDIGNPLHDWIRFSIKDSGIGLDKDKQNQLHASFDQNAIQHNNQINTQLTNQLEKQTIHAGVGLITSYSFAKLLGGFIELQSSTDEGSTFDLYLPCRHPNYQPIYHFNSQLNHIHLIAVMNQKLSAEHLQRLCDYLSISAYIYTSIDSATIQKLTQKLAKNSQILAPILLLDYEYYESNAIVFPKPAEGDDKTIRINRHKALSHLLANISLPKILLSMKPERRIPSMLLDQCDGFLAKPLDSALLLSELMRLTMPVRQTFAPVQSLDTESLDTESLDTERDALATEMDSTTIDTPAHKTTDENTPPLILVVEDSPTNQKIACKILTKLGYRTVVAEDGQQALIQLQAQHKEIVLILMDCRMPVMDGLQATQAIRAQGNDIPIVALTANNSAEDRDACFEAGMNEFLTKPIDRNKLKIVLQNLIKN